MATVDVVTQPDMPVVEDHSLNIPHATPITEECTESDGDSPLMNVCPELDETEPEPEEDDEEEDEGINANDGDWREWGERRWADGFNCGWMNWKLILGAVLAVAILAYLVWVHIQLSSLEHRLAEAERHCMDAERVVEFQSQTFAHYTDYLRSLDTRLNEVECKPVFLKSQARQFLGELGKVQKNVVRAVMSADTLTSGRRLAMKFNTALRKADAFLNNMEF